MTECFDINRFSISTYKFYLYLNSAYYLRVAIYYLTAKPSINDYTIYRGFIFSYTLLLNKGSHCKAIYSYLFKN